MKHSLITLALLAASMNIHAQVPSSCRYYTRNFADKSLVKKSKCWTFCCEKWRGSFDKAHAHKSVNSADFYTQYEKNQKQWDALFEWLQNHDMLTIPAGKHKIEGTDITVSVEDSKNDILEKRQSESHYHKIDFQWVVKGTERFGILDHYTSKPNCKYRTDVIHYDYDVNKTLFYDSTPDEFFLFFPGDWHIAKINNDTDDQVIRVIVAKIDYIE